MPNNWEVRISNFTLVSAVLQPSGVGGSRRAVARASAMMNAHYSSVLLTDDAVPDMSDDKDEEMAMETDTDAPRTLGARRQRVRLRAIVPEFSPHARFPASTRR